MPPTCPAFVRYWQSKGNGDAAVPDFNMSSARPEGPPAPARQIVLEMRAITQRFPGVLALNRVSLRLHRAEVLALMGENGAGKSTLMKILGGAQTPGEGEIRLDGKAIRIPSVAAAKALGIGLIHQELMLAPNLDVASNIFLGSERRKAFGALDRRQMEPEAERLMQRVGLQVSPRALVGTLTPGQRQMVEICKALRQNARILILDEPTSSLSLRETDRLLGLVAELRASGISLLYISHRLEEVFRVADRITVLRDGCVAGELEIEAATPTKLVTLMVGRDLGSCFPTRRSHPGAPVFSVKDLIVPGSRWQISFEASRGEIVGFAGLVGSGRTELMQVLAGIARSLSGTMSLGSTVYAPRTVADAIRQGVYLAPEDRKLHGLVLAMTIAENISLPDLKTYRPYWRFDFKREKTTACEAVTKLRIRPVAVDRKTEELSGGNQQKVVLAKWLAMNPRILILDEPTRGIDVGARTELYARIAALADSGLTILLVSSDLEEILGLSDRVVVMRDRGMSGVVYSPEMTKEKIGLLMTSEGKAA
jgi:ribose transport system ATP-binding protein